MAAATLEMENKELKKQTEDIEEMISLLKQLTSGEKREVISTHDLARRSTAIFTQKVFLSKSLFVLIAYNIFILY